MANTNEPFRRIGTNSWKELLDKVNAELSDPPDGCDPIEEIEIPEECHRWAKEDIQEVHDKLSEMPGDCFDFEPIPDLWKKSIIDDIEDQLENAWCDCEDEDCMEQCGNAVQGVVEIFLDTVCITDKDCAVIDECTATSADNDNCNTIHDEWGAEKVTYDSEKLRFSDNFKEACYREAELKVLNAELEKLQDELAELTDPNEILDKEAEIEAKEEEISEVEAEFEEAKTERDSARGLYVAAGQKMNELYFEAGNSICSDYVPLGIFVQGQSHPPTDAECYVKQPEREEGEPPPDPIIGIGAECFGDNFVGPGTGIFGGPLRCDVKWILDQRIYDITRKSCGGSDLPLRDTGFSARLLGEFDIDGNMVITDWRISFGCPEAILFAYCASSNCEDAPCFGNPSPCSSPGSEQCADYRLRLFFRQPHEPFDCEGGPCGDGKNEAP